MLNFPSSSCALALCLSLTAALGCPGAIPQDPAADPGKPAASGTLEPATEADFLLSDPELVDRSGDDIWRPGEAGRVFVTVTNISDEDFTYVGVRLESDSAELDIYDSNDMPFVLFAGSSLTYDFEVFASDELEPGSTPLLRAEVYTLGCQDPTDPEARNCPRFEPIEFALEVGPRALGPELVVESPYVIGPDEGDACAPGETCTLVVSLVNIGDEDDWNYPGVRVATDSAHVAFDRDEEWFFGAFAGGNQETWFRFHLAEDAEPGSLIELHAEAMRLNCEGNDSCPQSAPVTFDLWVSDFR